MGGGFDVSYGRRMSDLLSSTVLAGVRATRRPESRSRTARGWRWWLAFSSLAIAIVAPLPYLTTSLADLALDDNDIAVNYAARPGWVQAAFYLHVTLGGLAMLIAPLQLSSRVRARRPKVHRIAGRVGLVAIGVAGLAGLVLAPFNSAGAVGVAGFGLLAVAWLASAAMSYRTIRRGDVRAHRRWALRTFTLTYAAVTLRLWLGVLIPLQMAVGGIDADLAFDRAYQLVPFLCWVPNLALVEMHLNRRRPRRSAVAQRSAVA
jgi:uncharacterized membrane protein